MNQHTLSLIPIIIVMIVVIVRRVSRTIGLQKFHRRKMITRLAMLGVIGLLILSTSFLHPMTFAWDAAGFLVGGILAFVAVRTTQFEYKDGDVWYRPHPWVGMTVIALFLLRVIDRMYVTYTMTSSGTQPASSAYTSDPLTLATFFLLCAYYVIYYGFLLRKEHHVQDGTNV